MSPLQRIAMGTVIVTLYAAFPPDPDPAWARYDALPDPLGWLLVFWGVWGLGRSVDVDAARWAGVVALVVSTVLWLPQVNHLLDPAYTPDVEPALTWAAGLPPFVFGVLLARAIAKAGAAQEPRDRYVAGRFGVLTWLFAACAVLPVIGYNLPMDGGTNPTLSVVLPLVGLVQLVFAYHLFRVHRREYLGGPGPLEVHPTSRRG